MKKSKPIYSIVRVKKVISNNTKDGKQFSGKSFRVLKIVTHHKGIDSFMYYSDIVNGKNVSVQILSVSEDYTRKVQTSFKPQTTPDSGKLPIGKIKRVLKSVTAQVTLITKGRPFNYEGEDKKKLEKKAKSIKAVSKLKLQIDELKKSLQKS